RSAAGMARRALGHLLWPWNGLVHYADATPPASWVVVLALALAVGWLVAGRRVIGAVALLTCGGLFAAYLAGPAPEYSDGPAYLGLAGLVLVLPWCLRAVPPLPGFRPGLAGLSAALRLAMAWTSLQYVFLRQAPEFLWNEVRDAY